MSLKDKLNAKGLELESKAKANAELQVRSKNNLMRELPRIYSELVAKARTLLEGVEGVEISIDQKLRDIKRGETVIGQAQLSEFEIRLFGRTLAFKDDTAQYMGCHRHIDVAAAGATNPFPDGLTILESRANSDEWQVWVPPAQNIGTRSNRDSARLTDEVFEQALEKFFG